MKGSLAKYLNWKWYDQMVQVILTIVAFELKAGNERKLGKISELEMA